MTAWVLFSTRAGYNWQDGKFVDVFRSAKVAKRWAEKEHATERINPNMAWEKVDDNGQVVWRTEYKCKSPRMEYSIFWALVQMEVK